MKPTQLIPRRTLLIAIAVMVAGLGSYKVLADISKRAPEEFLEFNALTLDGGRRLNVGRFEVSNAQWKLCAEEGRCRQQSKSEIRKPNHPVTKVNWFDAQDYIAWINDKTGKSLRLPTLSEWNAIAANHKPKPKEKLFTDPRLAWAADYDITAGPRIRTTRTGGKFGYNTLKLADVKGNVWEWTSSECGMLETRFLDNCRAGRIVMGEHLAVLSDLVRDPGNASCGVGLPPANLGFRLVFDG